MKTTHNYLIEWEFNYSDLGKCYSLRKGPIYVEVLLKKDNISTVILAIGDHSAEAPNLKSSAQLFNLLYSFDLLK